MFAQILKVFIPSVVKNIITEPTSPLVQICTDTVAKKKTKAIVLQAWKSANLLEV